MVYLIRLYAPPVSISNLFLFFLSSVCLFTFFRCCMYVFSSLFLLDRQMRYRLLCVCVKCAHMPPNDYTSISIRLLLFLFIFLDCLCSFIWFRSFLIFFSFSDVIVVFVCSLFLVVYVRLFTCSAAAFS